VRAIAGERTTIGEKTGTRTMLAGIAEDTGTPLKKLAAIASEFVAFFKHADRDPTAVLTEFTEKDADMVLYVACNDFHRVAKEMPIELQVYAAWWLAQVFKRVGDAGLRVQPFVRKGIKLFPGIRAAPSRSEQLRIGNNWKRRAAIRG
jgi:hypothetical protein